MSDNEDTSGLEGLLNEAAGASQGAPQQPQAPTPAPPARPGNEIFADEAVEKLTQQEYAKRELGFEIPVDAVPLPSGGKVYSETHPLHGAGQVEYRAMTAKEEDILMSRALIKKGTVITELIKSCMVDKRIDVNSLLSGDRNALMVGIRISGYGQMYSPTLNCPNCEYRNELEVDLAQLDIKPLDLEPVLPGRNMFRVELPVSKFSVDYQFLTGAQEEEITKEMNAKKQKRIKDNIVTSRLLQSIVAINGDSNRGKIAKFVSNMPARDSLALRQHMDKHEPGINMEVEFECTDCGYEDTIQLPMDSSFFWPGSNT